MERGVKLCVLCFNFVSNSSTTAKTGGRRKPCKKVVDSRDPQIFSKFLAQLARFSTSPLELKDPDHIPVCSYCFTSIKAWVCTREKTEEQEKLVYSLQVQLLKELRILEGYLEGCSVTFKILEDTVRNFDGNPETIDEGGDGWQSEVGGVREAILEAGSSFRLRRTSPESRVEKEMEEATRRMRQEKLQRNRSAMVSDSSSSSSFEQKTQLEDETKLETGSGDMDVVVKTEEWQVKVEDEDEGSEVNCSLMDDVGDGDGTDDGDDADGQESDGSSDDGESESDLTDKSMVGVSDSLANFLKAKGISLEGASEVRKRVILNWVREQVQAPPYRIRKGKVASDYLWFKNKYKLEFSPEEGFSLAGIKIIWNEEENYFKCSRCEYRYRQALVPGKPLRFKSTMSQHIFAYHLDVYTCRICGDKAKFKNGRTYKAHMMMHRGEEGAPACEICGKVIMDKGALIAHRFTHMNAEEKEESKRNGTWRGNEPKKLDPSQCPICMKQLSSARALMGHMKTHKDRKEREDLVQCEDCGKTMIEVTYRRRHSKVCPGKGGLAPKIERPCLQCHKTFSSFSGLNVHIATAHNDHRPFQCEVCGMRFKIKSHLSRHRMLHSEKKEFKCERCGQEFPLKHYLKRHEIKCSVTSSDHT